MSTFFRYGIICVLVPLWVLSPRSTAEFAWSTFRNPGWSSAGLSALIGMQASVVPMLGADASVHMSEELKDAAYTLPRSMMWATTINGAMGWVTAITVAYCVGDLEEGNDCLVHELRALRLCFLQYSILRSIW